MVLALPTPPPKLQLRRSTMLDQLIHVQGLWLCRAELRVLKYDFRHWILVGDSSGFEIHFLFMLLRLVYLLGLSHTHTFMHMSALVLSLDA